VTPLVFTPFYGRCLSGNTAEAIQKVDPQFIKAAKIEQSLTPGRNNGFLNMLKTMKEKAVAIDAAARSSGAGATEVDGESSSEATKKAEVNGDSSSGGAMPDMEGQGPKYKAMVNALQVLKPTSLQLVDNSHQHAGHAGNDMDGESHFELTIIADAFEGLNLVKRHQLIYMVLGDIMQQIHALQIQSLTPAEAEQRGL
jgi:BolA protein